MLAFFVNRLWVFWVFFHRMYECIYQKMLKVHFINLFTQNAFFIYLIYNETATATTLPTVYLAIKYNLILWISKLATLIQKQQDVFVNTISPDGVI